MILLHKVLNGIFQRLDCAFKRLIDIDTPMSSLLVQAVPFPQQGQKFHPQRIASDQRFNTGFQRRTLSVFRVIPQAAGQQIGRSLKIASETRFFHETAILLL